jgi:hypothetical protein
MKKNFDRFFKDRTWGRVVVLYRDRRWWNPLRYILGKRYLKQIPVKQWRGK